MTKMEQRDRFAEIDLLRGVALSLMIVFHLLWDLDYYGMKPLDKQTYQYAPITAILFFLVVGISIMLSVEKKTVKQMIVRSLIILSIGCCISVVSLFVLPEKPVYFGVLHCIGISMIIGTTLRRLDILTLSTISVLTMICGIVIGVFYLPSSSNIMMIIGLHSNDLQTVDYFPLFPWLGVVLFGMALSRVLYKDGKRQFPFPDITRFLPTRFISWLGKHSLPIYILHQPALSGLLVYIVPMVVRYIPHL